jgi:hypothetical protein
MKNGDVYLYKHVLGQYQYGARDKNLYSFKLQLHSSQPPDNFDFAKAKAFNVKLAALETNKKFFSL